jgi:hypothetical protein
MCDRLKRWSGFEVDFEDLLVSAMREHCKQVAATTRLVKSDSKVARTKLTLTLTQKWQDQVASIKWRGPIDATAGKQLARLIEVMVSTLR